MNFRFILSFFKIKIKIAKLLLVITLKPVLTPALSSFLRNVRK